MPEESSGEGQALDAGVSTEPVATPSVDALAEAVRVVELAQRKLQKQRDHLAGAEASLAEAAAARDALKGDGQ